MGASIKTPFLQATQETSCWMMLADISGFSKIAASHTNRDVTDFLVRFHAAMQDVCYDAGAEIKHESGDSFWAFTRRELIAKALAHAFVSAYDDFKTGFEAMPDLQQTSLRIAAMPAHVIAYEIAGDRHYNSREHVILREAVENLPRDHSLVSGFPEVPDDRAPTEPL